jgi:hypothetical protein
MTALAFYIRGKAGVALPEGFTYLGLDQAPEA